MYPLLKELSIDGSAIGEGGALIVQAMPADPDWSLAADAGVMIALRTSRGDAEEALLGSEICTLESGRQIECNKFSVMMHDGRHIDEVRPFLSEVAGRLIVTRVCGPSGCLPEISEFGTVRIFEGDLEAAMRSARRWPGVRSVDDLSVRRPAGGPVVQNRLAGGTPLDFTAPVLGDGILQVLAGDTVTVEYQQPDGDVLRAAITLR